jgi:hypothetical protein
VIAVLAEVKDAEAGGFDFVFDAAEVFDIIVFAFDGDGCVESADLVHELEVFVAGVGAELHGDLHVGGPGSDLGRVKFERSGGRLGRGGEAGGLCGGRSLTLGADRGIFISVPK